METKDELVEEVRALSEAAETARGEFHAAAVLLADAVVRNRNNVGDIRNAIADEIRNYIEEDKRYTKAVNEASDVCTHLAMFLGRGRKGGVR